MKVKQETGSDAGASYSFGIRNAAELETYGKGIRVIDEWAYVDEPEMRPNLYKYLGISRVQWTVTVAINED
jgi:hypothetical protein